MVPRETPVSPTELLAANLAEVRARIDAAAERSSRDPRRVTLVVVTKGIPVDVIGALPPLGVTNIGESRIQEAGSKIDVIGDAVQWHLIGHLQRNKARRVVGRFALIHSLDSLRLLDHLNRIAGEADETVSALLEVNVAEEDRKHGIAPGDVPSFLVEAATRERVEIRGFMGMAPYVAEPEESRSCFSRLARIRDEADAASWYRRPLPELSMGMTNDFEIAVEEGATIVRIGTAVFRDVAPFSATDFPSMRAEER